VKRNFKTRIRYNGQEYSDPKQLPPEVRAAYQKAMQDKGPAQKKFLVNSEAETPDDVRRLCADVMSVVQNNGHVTLPVSNDGFLTKRHLKTIGSAVGAFALVALLILAKRFG
jgi:hypothetical protein